MVPPPGRDTLKISNNDMQLFLIYVEDSAIYTCDYVLNISGKEWISRATIQISVDGKCSLLHLKCFITGGPMQSKSASELQFTCYSFKHLIATCPKLDGALCGAFSWHTSTYRLNADTVYIAIQYHTVWCPNKALRAYDKHIHRPPLPDGGQNSVILACIKLVHVRKLHYSIDQDTQKKYTVWYAFFYMSVCV